MARELSIIITVEAEKAKAELAELERRMKANERAFTEGKTSVDEYAAKQDYLARALARSRAENEKLTAVQKTSTGATTQATAATGQLVDVIKRYAGPAVLLAAVKSTMDWAGSLQDLSARTGLSTASLQRFGVIAEQNGSSMSALATSIQMMSDRLYSGDKSAVKAVEQLGLSLNALLKMAPEDAFRELARAVASVEDPMKRNAVVVDLFGRSGKELLPVLLAIAEGLDQDIPVASEHAIKSLDRLGDMMTAFKFVTKVAIAEATVAVVDFLKWISMMPDTLAQVEAWNAGLKLGRASTPSGAETDLAFRAQWERGGYDPNRVTVSSIRAGKTDIGLGGSVGAALTMSEAYTRVLKFVRELTLEQKANIAAGHDLGKTNKEVADSLGLVGDAAKYAEDIVKVYEKQLSATEKQTKKTKQATDDWLKTFREGYAITGALAGTLAGGLPWITRADLQQGQLELIAPSTRGTSLNPLFGGGLMTGPMVTPYNPFAQPAKPGFFQAGFGGAGGFGGGLASTMLSAFTGGGDIGKSVGGFIGGGIGQGIVGQFSESFAKTFMGGALSSILPGIGSLLGPLVGWIGGLFGEGGRTRKMRDQWIEAAGGLKAVREMAEYAGVSIDRLLSTKKTKVFEAEVKKLEAAFAAAQKRVQALITDLGKLAERGGLISGDLARRLTADLAKPEVQEAFKAFVKTNLQSATEGLTRYLEAAKDLPMTAKSAAALGAALAGIWKQSVALGMSAREALQAMLPAIQALQQRLAEAGLSGGEAFGLLLEQATLATDAITGPLIDGVDGLTQAMIGLANAGLLTEDMFQGLAEQVGVTYQKLIDQGVSAEAALRAIAPSLQRIWELQQKYGWAVDDATQALIDQGKEAGLVGEHMKDVMSQVLDVLKAIAKVLGADIPGAAKAASDAIGGIQPPRYDLPDETGGGRGPRAESFQWGSGGVRDFGGGTPALLHGREAVVTEAQLRALLAGRGSGPTISITIQALDTQSVRTAVEQEIAPQLVEVLRQNVRGLRTDTQYALGVR